MRALRAASADHASRARRRFRAKLLAFATVFVAPVAFAAAGIDLPELVVEVLSVVTRERPHPPNPAPLKRSTPERATAPSEPSELEVSIDSIVVTAPPEPPPALVAEREAPRPHDEPDAATATEPLPETGTDLVRQLVANQRYAEAEATLRQLGAADEVPTPEENLLWGELYASEGDCHRAIDAFDRVLEQGAPELEEEALYRRAVCHAWVGDALSSHADIDLYLMRFPHGRYVAVLKHRYRR